MFGYVGIFLLIDIPVYWLLSKDTVGTTALSMAFGLCTLVWFYLYFTAIRIGPRPEDRDDAEISEMAGELGFFSPHSWWPLYTAAAVVLIPVVGEVALPSAGFSWSVVIEYGGR